MWAARVGSVLFVVKKIYIFFQAYVVAFLDELHYCMVSPDYFSPYLNFYGLLFKFIPVFVALTVWSVLTLVKTKQKLSCNIKVSLLKIWYKRIMLPH